MIAGSRMACIDCFPFTQGMDALVVLLGVGAVLENVACIDVLAGNHPEDVKVLRTVCQGQFNLHAVVIGVGEDAVLRKFVQAKGNKDCFICWHQFSVYRQYHKKIGWFTQR